MSTTALHRYTNRIVLVKPHVTEKAALANAAKSPVYTFMVDMRANKAEIINAIKTLYKVTPVKVNIVISDGKRVVSRGRQGKQADTKKAYVFLKAGDSIEIA